MRPVFLALFLLLSGTRPATAQQVTYSPYTDFSLSGGATGVVGKIGGNIFTFRYDGGGAFLDAWDEAMQPVATVILDFIPAKAQSIRMFAVADSMVAVYEYSVGRDLFLYAAVLDAEGRLLKRPFKLDQLRTGLFGTSDKDRFEVVASDDRRHFVAYQLEDQSRNVQLKAVSFGADLTVTNRATLSYRDSEILLGSKPVVLQNGSFVLPVRSVGGSRESSSKMMLLTLPEGAKKLDFTSVPLAGKYLYEPLLKTDRNTAVFHLAGYYGDSRNAPAGGVLLFTIDNQTGAIRDSRTAPFDAKLRTQAASGGSTKNAFANQKFQQLLLRNDGGFATISEESFISARTSTVGMGMGGFYSMYNDPFMNRTLIREYFNNDVVLLSFDSTANLQWSTVVRKEQYSQEDGGLFASYALLNTGSEIGILYNDFNTRQSTIQFVTVDEDGHQERKSFVAAGDNSPDWIPSSARQVSAREVIVPCLARKKLCFAKVAF